MQKEIQNKKEGKCRPYIDGAKRLPVPEVILQKAEFGELSHPSISIANRDGVAGVPRQHAKRRSEPDLFLPKQLSMVEKEKTLSVVRSDLTDAVLRDAWSDSSVSSVDNV